MGRLLERAVRRPDAHLLDLGCGSGTWLLRALEAHPGATAEGVDISDAGFGRTRAAAADLGIADRLELSRQDVTEFRSGRKADVVLSVGSAYAFGEVLPALDAARRHLADDGVVLFGDCFWEAEPSAALRAELEDGPQKYADLATTIAAITDHGWTPVYGHVSTLEEWDEYEWCWTGSLARWALDNPDHPDHEQALRASNAHREGWLNGYRGVLGFVVLLLRRTD
ncbi:SAM-dependent methyltransferase [Amycolatopsis pittospori]|uniref:SAM-dependent methyltransferase n=1 Tax=Amycolatopsis pittospori TaxID=2749434 RepID=UPI002E2ABD3F|nr:class I SAM-dependent methyltransferase [Amycolatopsis pittospori]